MSETMPTIIEPIRGNSNWGNWCKHYNGLMDRLEKRKCCEAGVEYESVKTPIDFILQRQRGDRHPYPHKVAYPCFMGQHTLAKPCPKQQFPTDEEIAAHDDESDKHVRQIGVAREAILQDLRRRWKEGPTPEHGITAPADISRFHKPQTNYFCGRGKMKCPICADGTLGYSRSDYNGHIHARCSTMGCVAWME